MTEKHFLPVTIEKSADADYDARFVMSASTPDRVNDTIDPQAYQSVNVPKLIALWQHKSDQPIGFWHGIEAKGTRLIGKLKIASTNLGLMIKQLIEDGVPLGASIGFRGSGEPNKKGGIHFKEIEIFECSVVSVPAHPRAMAIAKSFGLEADIFPDAGPSSVPASSSPGTSVRSQTPSKKDGPPMSIAERIKAAEEDLNSLRDRAANVVKSLDDEDADVDVLSDELETTNEAITKAERLLKNLKDAEAKLAVQAEPVKEKAHTVSSPGVAPNLGHERQNRPSEKGLFAKMAVATLVADKEKISVPAAIEQTYGDAEYMKSAYSIMRSKSVEGEPPLNTYTTTAAQELLVAAQNDFVEGIKVASVAANLGARCRQISFNGASSRNLTMRDPTALTGLTEPAWVHEGRPIPTMGYSIGQQTVDRGKIAAIIPFTMELLEANKIVSLEAELRDAMIEAGAVRLDNTFFSNVAAVVRVHPAGILNGVTVTAGKTGGGIAAVSEDIQTLYTKLTTARLGARPVVVMNTTDRMAAGFLRTTLGDLAFRDELASSSLMGIPIIDGPTIPQHTLIIVDTAYVAFGLDTPMFDMSTQATIVPLNADGTTPSMAGLEATGDPATKTPGSVDDASGVTIGTAGATTPASPARSFWQTYSGGLRMIQFGGWKPIAGGAVQALNTTTWS